MAAVDFGEALERLGFAPSQERPSRGVKTYVMAANRYLTHWVHTYEDGTALFSWEFAVTDYLLERRIQLGSSERLNLFMYPAEDERGPQDPGWLVSVLDRAEAQLRSINFAEPEG